MHNLLGESSEEIAQWLFKGELLSKRAIGDYLGEGYSVQQNVAVA